MLPPISELIPHTGPAVALDDIVEHWDADSLTGRVTVDARSSLVTDGRARGAAALEYIAQAVAAHLGILSHLAGEPIRRGYVLAIRSARLDVPFFELGDTLEITVHRQAADDRVGTYRGEVTRSGEVLAVASLTVYREEGSSAVESASSSGANVAVHRRGDAGTTS